MNNILFITHLLNALTMVIFPILLGIFFVHRFNLGWRLWWIGAATFVLSQIGHIPFNRLLTYLFEQGILPSPPENWQLVFNAVVLGLSAGIWEESTRYATYRLWAKDARTWNKALMLGAGHGGIEAILLGALVLLTYFQMVALQDVDLVSVVPANRLAILQARVDYYWSLPWTLSLLGSLERGFTIMTHLALSVIVLQVFTRNHIHWLWIAIGWHALTNATALITLGRWGPYAAEAALAVVALIDVVFIFRLRQSEPVEIPIETPLLAPQPTLAEKHYSIKVAPDRLEETKYD